MPVQCHDGRRTLHEGAAKLCVRPLSSAARVAERSQQRVASLRLQLLDRQIAECTDGLPELMEVTGTALAEREVIDEPPFAFGIERVADAPGDHVD
jgi:hypothetical protein